MIDARETQVITTLPDDGATAWAEDVLGAKLTEWQIRLLNERESRLWAPSTH